RALADDLGRALGSGGALKSLRRTASGPFQLDRAIPLAQLEALAGSGPAERAQLESRLVPMVDALPQPPLLAVPGEGRGRRRPWSTAGGRARAAAGPGAGGQSGRNAPRRGRGSPGAAPLRPGGGSPVNVTVLIPSTLRAAVDGKHKLDLGVPAGAGVGEV